MTPAKVVTVDGVRVRREVPRVRVEDEGEPAPVKCCPKCGTRYQVIGNANCTECLLERCEIVALVPEARQ